MSEIDAQAETIFFQLVERLAKREGVTEQLKVENQIEWVGRMNIIRNQATEVINIELIFT